jgi:protein tyrosine/serine phosphatase
MRRRLARPILVGVVSLCYVVLGLAQDDQNYKELPNFHRVNATLYRGAQPERGGIQRLSQLGIKTIINLRDDDARARSEEQEARAAGLRYFNVPFKRLGRPTDEQVTRVLGLINALDNGTVFVHCQHGADRTGIIVAIYRIDHDGWTSEQAKAEASRFGMKSWQLGMKEYIHDYYLWRSSHTTKISSATKREPVCDRTCHSRRVTDSPFSATVSQSAQGRQLELVWSIIGRR